MIRLFIAVERKVVKMKQIKGFTLIELLAVLVILGVIALIVFPLIGDVINSYKESHLKEV